MSGDCRAQALALITANEKGQPEGWPKSLILLVGARRFELPTPCTPYY